MKKTIEILQNLIAIDTQNPPGNEGEIVRYLQNFITKHTKGRCVIQKVEKGRDNLLVYFGKNPTYLFNVHTDTVQIGDRQKWRFDPFAGEIKNGKIFGRGACDNKGAIAAMIGAILTSEPQHVLFLFNADEEQTGKGMKLFLESGKHHGIRGALVAEPTSRKILVSHMGICGLKLVFHGQSCHSSVPEQGVNSINLANHFLNILQKYYQNVIEQVENKFLGSGVMSVAYIMGGRDTPVGNTVPDYCELKIDFRYIPEYDSRKILEAVKKLVSNDSKLKGKTEVQQIYGFPSFQTDIKTHSMVKMIKEIDSKVELIGARYYTEAADLQEAGINTIVFGAGNLAQAHKVDEFITIDDLKYAEMMYGEIFRRLK